MAADDEEFAGSVEAVGPGFHGAVRAVSGGGFAGLGRHDDDGVFAD